VVDAELLAHAGAAEGAVGGDRQGVHGRPARGVGERPGGTAR
jgi:hypothetical protein